METTKKRGTREWIINILFCLGVIFILILLFEIGFRIFYPQPLYDECDPRHPAWPRPMMISDPLLGHVAKPNGRWCLYQPDTNKKITVTTNSKGQRTLKEHTYQKPPNTFRVVVFGDSFVWAENMNDSETFPFQLEKEVQKRFNKKKQIKKVEVIPFGVGEYGTTESFLGYWSEGYKYNADLALYMFYQNDFTDFVDQNARYPKPAMRMRFTDNSTEHGWVMVSAEDMLRMWREGNKGETLFPWYNDDYNKPIEQPAWYKRFFIAHSHFFNFANRIVEQRGDIKKREEKDSNLARLLEKISTSNRYGYRVRKELKPKDDFGRDLMYDENLIIYFSKEVDKHETTFVLVNIPSVYQIRQKFKEIIVQKIGGVRGSSSSTTLETLKQEGRLRLLTTETENFVLRGITKRNNIPFIDLTTTAREHEDKFYHKTDDHWSPRGAEVSATYIADQLDQQGLLKAK